MENLRGIFQLTGNTYKTGWFLNYYYFTSALKIQEFHQIPARHCSEAEQSQSTNVKVVLCSTERYRGV